MIRWYTRKVAIKMGHKLGKRLAGNCYEVGEQIIEMRDETVLQMLVNGAWQDVPCEREPSSSTSA